MRWPCQSSAHALGLQLPPSPVPCGPPPPEAAGAVTGETAAIRAKRVRSAASRMLATVDAPPPPPPARDPAAPGPAAGVPPGVLPPPASGLVSCGCGACARGCPARGRGEDWGAAKGSEGRAVFAVMPGEGAGGADRGRAVFLRRERFDGVMAAESDGALLLACPPS